MPHHSPQYAPDDAALTAAALRALAAPEGRTLRLAALEADPASPAALEKLRRTYPRELVHAALVLAKVHRKATIGPAAKFPKMPWFWGVPEALEQATSLAVAQHKARRFAALQPRPAWIADLCAGAGGDALALGQVAKVLAVELSEVRAQCAALNAREAGLATQITVVRADVTNLPLPRCDATPTWAFHLDPARRSAGKRSHAYADLIPGPSAIEPVLQGFSCGALKLSPGVEFASLPAGHLEIISEAGTCVQAVLWTGILAQALGGDLQRTASTIAAGRTFSFTALWNANERPQLTTPQRFLYEVDPAVHRAGLAAALAKQLHAEPLNTDLGYLTTSERIDHPGWTRFSHLTTVPWSEKRVVTALRSLPSGKPGPVEVKPRGGLPIDTDRLQTVFAKATPRACTVLIYRAGEQTWASMATREST